MNNKFFNDRGEGCWVTIKWGTSEVVYPRIKNCKAKRAAE